MAAFSKQGNKISHYILIVGSFMILCSSFFACRYSPENTEINNSPVKEIEPYNSGMLYPCHWSFSVEQKSPNEATLVSTVKIDSGWHLYSQYISDVGSPTTFTYDSLPDYILEGETEEGESYKEYDEYLQTDILYFVKEAVFRQKIKVVANKDFKISGTINHTACLTQCVTSDEDFLFLVKGSSNGN